MRPRDAISLAATLVVPAHADATDPAKKLANPVMAAPVKSGPILVTAAADWPR